MAAGERVLAGHKVLVYASSTYIYARHRAMHHLWCTVQRAPCTVRRVGEHMQRNPNRHDYQQRSGSKRWVWERVEEEGQSSSPGAGARQERSRETA